MIKKPDGTPKRCKYCGSSKVSVTLRRDYAIVNCRKCGEQYHESKASKPDEHEQ